MDRNRILRPVLQAAHEMVGAALTPGAYAVDATVGNGHDTLFLARAVGPAGTVIGFDVQQAAISATRTRLQEAGVADRVQLVQRGHEHLLHHVPEAAKGKVRAVTFNLGYLPGAEDRSIITRPSSTVAALSASTEVLAPGGLISVVLYRGHPGGLEEAEAVLTWGAALPQTAWSVLSYHFVNQRGVPPALLAIERRSP